MARPITQLGRLAAAAVLLWLAQAGAPAAALAPSFSCAAASTPVERLICGSGALAGRDLDMARLYAAARERTPAAGRDALRDSQRAWMARRAGECAQQMPASGAARSAAVACLAQLYDARLTELDADGTGFLHVLGDPQPAAEGRGAYACFTMNRPLEARPGLPHQSFVTVSPAASVSVRTDGALLCVDGLAAGSDYAITLMAGLAVPDASLRADRTYAVTTPDLPPALRFATRGSILPRVGASGLPVEAINVGKVRVVLLRVTDDALIDAMRDGHVSDQVSYGQVGWLASTIGRNLWQGELDVAGPRNAPVKAAIPVQGVLAGAAPGLYLAVIGDADERQQSEYWAAGLWFTVSDIGLTSFEGEDGLTVLARSAATAAALDGVTLRLRSTGNKVLASATTGPDGLARIEPGFLRGSGDDAPAMLMAYGPAGDFVTLSLGRPPLDLSDRGVSGRVAPGPVDAYVTTERGIYRPGESVHVTALVRDDKAAALAGLPAELVVSRPDGVVVWRHKLDDAGAGGATARLDLPANASTGRWTAAAWLPGAAKPVGQVRFLVEDFVPPRIEVGLQVPARVEPGDGFDAAVSADFLYGAPGAGLPGELEVTLRPRASAPSGLTGFRFGLAEEERPAPRQAAMASFTLDEAGRHTETVALAEVPDTSHPLEAVLRTTVFDVGGRPVSARKVLAVATHPIEIGIRPDDAGAESEWRDTVRLDASTGFSFAVLGADGARAALPRLAWRLVREDVSYFWYRPDGGPEWRYRIDRTDAAVVDQGEVAVTADALPRVEPRLEHWADYRLEASDPESGVVSSLRFYTGWRDTAPSAGDRAPDMVRLELQPDAATPGGSARVFVKPPYAATVQLTVAGARVHSSTAEEIGPDGAVVELPLPDGLAAGVYVLVNAFGRPDGIQAQAPRRAVGALWVPYDPAPRTLAVTLDTPDRSLPETRLPVVVRLDAQPGEAAYVTLAAVDDGVLGLTGYKAPDPGDHYLGRRALGLTLRDLYGRFIDPAGHRSGRLRSGGDEAAMSGSAQLANLPKKSQKVTALFSGILKAGADGSVAVPLDLPDFDGRLRLMAMAWSAGRLGAAETTVTVRRPVIADIALPRFLAPGDEAEISVSLHNLDGPAGRYRASVSVAGPLSVATAPALDATLAPGGRLATMLTVSALAPGDGALVLTVEGPDGLRIQRRREISVRTGNAWESRRLVARIEPGGSLTPPDATYFQGYHPETLSVSFGVNPLPDLGLPLHLKALADYPYGCTEQRTSTTMPLLLAGVLAKHYDMRTKAAPADAIARGVDGLLAMQTQSGGFGFWSSDGEERPWLTAYVMDFLVRARAAGHAVPAPAFDRGLVRLSSIALSNPAGGGALSAASYAIAVLARAGAIEPVLVRRFHAVRGGNLQLPFERAQLAAAFAAIGDRAAAREAFAAAAAPPAQPEYWRDGDYSSPLRDQAALVALMAESGAIDPVLVHEAAERLSVLAARDRWVSTQERAWLVRAGHALLAMGAPDVRVFVDDRPLVLTAGQPFVDRKDGDGSARLPRLRNASDRPVYGFVDVLGQPSGAPPAEGHGFTVERRLFDRRGEPVDAERLRAGELVVVTLSGQYQGRGHAEALVVDYLPAGLELENIALGGAGSQDFAWVGATTQAGHVELRDDRYVASVSLDGNPGASSTFRLAYVARAVTAGRFAFGGAYVEDMYRPDRFARGPAGRLVVGAR